MRWKGLLTVFVVVLLLTTIVLTDVGRKYAGYFTNLVGSFANTILKTPEYTGKTFAVTLTTNKENFFGQTYKVQNSTFIGSGNYLYIKVDGGTETVKDTTAVDVWVGSMDGNFEYTTEGTVRLAVSTNRIIINNVERTREKPYNLETEIQPNEFVLTPVSLDKISFSAIDGSLRLGTKTIVSIELNKANVDIYNFIGYLQLVDDTVTINGFAGKIVVNGEEVISVQ